MSQDAQQASAIYQEGYDLQVTVAKAEAAGRDALVGKDEREIVTMEFSKDEAGNRNFERVKVASSWKSRGAMAVGMALMEAQMDLMRQHYENFGSSLEDSQKSIKGRQAFVKPTARVERTRRPLQPVDERVVNASMEQLLQAFEHMEKMDPETPASQPKEAEAVGIGASGKVRVHAAPDGRITQVEIDEDWANSQSNVSLGAALTEACKDAAKRAYAIEDTKSEWDEAARRFGNVGFDLDRAAREAGI